MKINWSARKCVLARKRVKLIQDELFSIFKSEHILRVYKALKNKIECECNADNKIFFYNNVE